MSVLNKKLAFFWVVHEKVKQGAVRSFIVSAGYSNDYCVIVFITLVYHPLDLHLASLSNTDKTICRISENKAQIVNMGLAPITGDLGL